MRLTKKMEEVATAELLEILRRYPARTTSDLSNTPKFHGERTLSNRQIIRLLNVSGKAQSTLSGYGNRTYFVWTLKPNDTDGRADATTQEEQVSQDAIQ